MKSIEAFLTEVSGLGVKLWLEGEQLRCQAPKGKLTPELQNKLREYKADIIQFLQQMSLETDAVLSPILPVARDGNLPLSFAQERLWFLNQLEGKSATYNIAGALRLEGQLNISALEKSLTAIVERHEILRTRFQLQGETPIQIIDPPFKIELPIVELQGLSETEQEIRLRTLIQQNSEYLFDLAHECLMRVALIRLGETSHILLYNMHHIIFDGWSIGIFLQELSTFYQDFAQGNLPSLPPLNIQYADFSYWQKQWLNSDRLAAHLNYWKTKLAEIPPQLALPTDFQRPAIRTFRGRREKFQIDSNLSQKIQTLSQDSGTTLFMTLLTAFSILLARYSQQKDIIIGSPIANRNRQEIEPLIGFFVNTLALRIKIEENPTFSDLLTQVKQNTLEAYQYQDLPFEKLVEELHPERNLSHSPIFQVMFILQNATRGEAELPGLTLSSLSDEGQISKFDLTLSMWETEDGLAGDWQYNIDLFEDTTIERINRHFQTLLTGIVNHPHTPIYQLPLLTEREKGQILYEWNNTQKTYNFKQRLHHFIEQQTEKTPQNIAAIYQQQQLSYQQLNQKANQLAHYLQTLGVKAEKPVGICVERSLEMLIGILAILKAGGAYLPIDPSYPQERVEYMLEDAKIDILLSQEHLQNRLNNYSKILIKLDSDRQLWESESQENLNVEIREDHLAYILYTSGSTGQPKGAMNTHKAIVNRLYGMQETYQLTEADRILQKTPFSFDVSVWELFWSSLVGATLIIAEPESHKDSHYLVKLIQEKQITTLHFVPSMLGVFAEEKDLEKCTSLKHLFVGGEPLTVSLQNRLYERLQNCQVHYLYGPTETAIDVTYWECDRENPVTKIPIGYPVTNTQIYILDSHQQPVPIGVTGELHIGGVQVGKGYLNRPQLTQEKFIDNLFTGEGKLYKSGDLARYDQNGIIEYLGRIDHQVKIRGFRVELGEIEAVLSQHPQIKELAVTFKEDEFNHKSLVAYLVPQEIQEHQQHDLILNVRDFLKEKLPEYMIPTRFVFLDVLPITPNGKIDRRALPDPDHQAIAFSEHQVTPRTPTEEIVANIWEQVLKVPKIGIYNNFFDLGGHSLLATQVISRIREAFKLEIPLRSLFEFPTVEQLSRHISIMRQLGTIETDIPLVAIALDQSLPLSFAQERLWFLAQLEPESTAYNMFLALNLRGNLNITALEQSFSEIIRRHQVLRTTFATEQGKPIQIIQPYAPYSLKIIDLQTLSGQERTLELESVIREESTYPFNLNEGPLLRLSLVILEPEFSVLLVSMHHIVSDGWSMGVFTGELGTIYRSQCENLPSPLPELPIQYADFAYWQRQWLTGEVLTRQLNYWKKQLSDLPPLHQLPTDYPRPPMQTFRGKREFFEIDPDLSQQIKALSQKSGTTLFMTLLTAFAVLITRYSQQQDIVIGSPIANRNRQEIEGLIGFFVNTLVLRIQIQEKPTFSQLLTQVKEITLEAYQHQDLPFEKLVEELQPERNLSHSPLFQIMFVWQNAPTVEEKLPGLELTPLSYENPMAKFDLTLSMREQEQGLSGEWEYNTDLFKPETIQRLNIHFQTLLTGIIASPQDSIYQLPLLTEREQQHILYEWNDTQKEYHSDYCLHQLIEQQAENNPDQIAVVYQDQSLTYHQLNQKANQLAHHLQTLGVEPEKLVGICLERSLEMIISILAILKAGGAYLPLDPNYPLERLSYMIEDAEIDILITKQQILTKLPFYQGQALCLEADSSWLSDFPLENPITAVNPSNLAYIIYTSGSTGKPKGVLLTHQGLSNLLQAQIRLFQVNCESRIIQFASCSFDASVWEITMALGSGATLYLAPSDALLPGEPLTQCLNQYKITHATLPPSALTVMNPQELEALKVLIVAGEAITGEMVRKWAKGRHFFNAYGPTETTVCATVAPCDETTQTPPIGFPIDNTQVYILDERLQPVPVGVSGELYIGGVGLARGYRNRPELTQEKFISHPFNPGERVYRTGDLARYLPDGQIEFLGRIDYQVKLRGFRIELGEIEAVLTQHPQINAVAVAVKGSELNDKSLVAYLVSSEQSTEQQQALILALQDFLKGKLPEYMIPKQFVFLEALPLTPNGKVDRRALPELNHPTLNVSQTGVPPRTPTEEILANIWAEVLKLPQVGIYNNFFDLGGHSLLATQVISRIRETFQVEIPIRTLFELPTIAQLSQNLSLLRQLELSGTSLSIKPIESGESLPLSFAQERLWFLAQFEPNSPTYNISTGVYLQGSLNIPALEQSLNEIIRRHQALRTSFQSLEGTPIQFINPYTPLNLNIINLQSLGSQQRQEEITGFLTQQNKRPFDLSQDLLLRVTLILLEEDYYLLLVNMHHIVSDGWSMGVFMGELGTLYRAFSENLPSPLPELPIQYADFAYWQRQWLTGEVLTRQLDYWKKQLSDLPPLHQLPTDYPRPPMQTFTGKSHFFSLEPGLSQEIKTLSQENGVTLFMTFLAAFSVLLARYSQQTDIIIGTPIANRNRQEIEGLIGFFVNTLVLRLDLESQPNFNELLHRVKRVTLDAYVHQDLPFEKLVEELQPERNLSYSPLFQIMFSFLNTPEDDFQLAGMNIIPLEEDSHGAKFDLSLGMRETEKGFIGQWQYNIDLFEDTTIERMATHFENLLKGIVANPHQPITHLPLLSEGEKQQILVDWNNTQADYPQDKCIHQLFEEQVERTPQAIALVFKEKSLTYQELNEQANILAHQLQDFGVAPEVLVGVYLERSLEMVVTILAILKAGGAYVPFDPKTPQERLKFISEETGLTLLITQSSLENKFDFSPSITRIIFENKNQQNFDLSDSNLQKNPVVNGLHSNHLAYVIYTSGTTGRPKGVAVEHRGVVNMILYRITKLFTAEDIAVVPLTVSIAFDASISQFLMPLSGGGKVLICEDTSDLYHYLQQDEITWLPLPPSVLNVVLQDIGCPNSLRVINVGTEPVNYSLVEKVYQYPQVKKMLNIYGPTEGSVYCTSAILFDKSQQLSHEKLPDKIISIGKPIQNVQIYLLDAYLQPVPIGVPGELHIGGHGVARGYFNRPELTQEKFIDNPFGDTGKLYKTGDLARYDEKGNIEYLGRIDHQVKIRGFRVELTEIETVLGQHPQIQGVAVIVREDKAGDPYLVGYLVCGEMDPQQQQTLSVNLQEFLGEKLPDYMIPQQFVFLEALPLTTNGKLDQRALPKPSQILPSEKNFVPPRNDIELKLSHIWSELLNIYPVSVQDSFFELGGHSLLAVRLVAKIEKLFGHTFPLATLFQLSSIEKIASWLSQASDSEGHSESGLLPIQPKGSKSPLFCLHPAGGSILCYYDLARYLGEEQPCYGLSSVNFNEHFKPVTRIEDMATYYIEAIQSLYPQGPYQLLGWSMGGLIAYEMAQQLQDQGQEVSFLGLLDTYILSLMSLRPQNSLNDVEILQEVFGVDLSLSWEELRALPPDEQLKSALQQAQKLDLVPPELDLPQAEKLLQVLKLNDQACKSYVPQPYPGKIILWRGKEDGEKFTQDSTLGWEALARGGVDLHWNPGGHSKMIYDPYVKVLVEQLSQYLR